MARAGPRERILALSHAHSFKRYFDPRKVSIEIEPTFREISGGVAPVADSGKSSVVRSLRKGGLSSNLDGDSLCKRRTILPERQRKSSWQQSQECKILKRCKRSQDSKEKRNNSARQLGIGDLDSSFLFPFEREPKGKRRGVLKVSCLR